MPGKLLLAGYFGCGNLGDDAILYGFMHGIENKNFEVTVLSGYPEETYRNYGFRAIPRTDMGLVRREIEACDALVFPGGSIFQDVTSTKSILYYGGLVSAARKAKKKVFLLSQGVGPVTGFIGKKTTRDAFSDADVISVRDPSSVTTLQSLGVKKNIRVTGDCAFMLPGPQIEEHETSFSVGSMKTIGIAPRSIPGWKPKATIQLFGDFARLLFTNNYMPVLIEMDNQSDGPLILDINRAQGGKVPDMRKLAMPMHAMQRMSRMDGLVAVRLHAGILGAIVGVPSLMISYDPKVSAFAKMMDLPQVSTEGLTAQRLFENFTTFMRDRERLVQQLPRKTAEMKQLAEENVRMLGEFFRS